MPEGEQDGACRVDPPLANSLVWFAAIPRACPDSDASSAHQQRGESNLGWSRFRCMVFDSSARRNGFSRVVPHRLGEFVESTTPTYCLILTAGGGKRCSST